MSKAKFSEAEIAEAVSKFTQSAEVYVQQVNIGYNKDIFLYKEPDNGQSQGSSQ